MSRQSQRIHPAIWLVYLLFYPAWPLLAGDHGELLKSGLVSAVFVPLYLWTMRHRGWRVLPAMLAIVGLGLYGCTSNLGAGVFFIYAAALGPQLDQPRRSYLWLAAVLAIEVVVALQSGAASSVPALLRFAPVLACSILIGVACIHQEAIDRKNDELRQSREEVTRLAKAAERERIARDLHDLLGHTLSLVVLKSQLASRLLARGDQRAGAEIAEVERIARQALHEVRAAIAGWQHAGLDSEVEGAAVACEAAGLRCERPAEAAADLPPLVEGALAMALREAVTNLLRHADATRCRLRFAAGAGAWVLEIEDDGRGLPKGLPAGAAAGNGMANIRERLARLGGEAVWLTAPGGGTLLRLTVPRREGALFEALERPAGSEAA